MASRREPQRRPAKASPRRDREGRPWLEAAHAAVRRVARRLAWPTVVVVAAVAVVVVGILPTRTYLDQRGAIASASERLAELEATNAALEERIARLDTDAEIERVAREQYGLVKPGEEVYRVVPEAQDPVIVPETWPFDQLRKRLGAAAPPEVRESDVP